MLKFITRDGSSTDKKSRIYFCCHPDDFGIFFKEVTREIFETQDPAIFYHDFSQGGEEADLTEQLDGMQLIVVAVNGRLLMTDNYVKREILPIAQKYNIPVLPIVRETGLDKPFTEVFGEIQYLDSATEDSTAISYKDKLKNFLDSVIVGDELAEQIRNAFDAYIFLSYRKKDRKHAQELMRLIHSNDFCRDIAIWYDEFLVPGEDFTMAILEALEKSPLFALTVTPNLLEQDNYVMKYEYPMALENGKKVVPVEFVDTDKSALKSAYANIPDTVSKGENAKLSQALLNALKNVALRSNDTPQHDFFIGLAYLSGIDVERNPDIAVELISSAADRGLMEATEKLAKMYCIGDGVKPSRDKTLHYQRMLVEQLCKEYQNNKNDDVACYRYVNAIYDLGIYLDDYLMTDEAYSELCKAAKVCEEMLSERYIEDVSYTYFRCFSYLGIICNKKHRYDEALQYCEKALTVLNPLYEKSNNSYKHHMASLQNAIAFTHLKLKNYDKAEPYFLTAKEIAKEYYYKNREMHCRAYAVYCSNLGVLCCELGKYDQSEEYYDEGISVCRKHCEAEKVLKDVLSVLYINKGDLYKLVNKPAQAETFYILAEECLEDVEEIFPCICETRYATIHNQLALVYFAEAKHQLAIERLELSIAMHEKLYGENPEIYGDILADNYNNLAFMLVDFDEFSKAEEYYKKAIAICEISYNKFPLAYGDKLCLYYQNICVCYSKAKNYMGFSRYSKATEKLAKWLCKNNRDAFLPRLALVYRDIGFCFMSLNNYSMSMKYYKKSVKCYKKLVAKHPEAYSIDLAICYNQIGLMLYYTHVYGKAQGYFTKAIQISNGKYSEADTISVANFHNNLYLVFLEQGRYVAAENELDISFRMKQTISDKSSVMAQVNDFLYYNNKGNLLFRCGKFAEAEKFYFTAFGIMKPLYENNPSVHYANYRIILENLVLLYNSWHRYDDARTFQSLLNQM